MTIARKIRLFIIGLFLGALSFTFIPHHYVDPDLQSYQDNFMETWVATCPKQAHLKQRYTVKFQDDLYKTSGYAIGLCKRTPWMGIITFDTGFWNTASPAQRYELFSHESAHCSMGLDHVNGNNYMAPSLSDLTTEETYLQLVTDMRKLCND